MQQRLIGVNFTESGEANVLLWAPEAKQNASIFLVKQNLSIPLCRQEHGYWHIKTNLLTPGDEYLFTLDGGKKLPDPASLSQPAGVHGPSQAIDVKQFEWNEQQWCNPPLADYLFYELHVGTFTTEATFDAVISKLNHLINLGITAIELMPVAQFPGSRNWGYDGAFPYAVQNTYGGVLGLKRLVNACHQKGLAVVLDVVYNHMGPEGNYFASFGPYFTSKYQTPWGNALNFDDAHCDEVRNYFIENVLMWFRDFHIDALRMDAVHAIKDFSAKHILQEIKEQVDVLQQQTNRIHYLIVECDLNDTRFINPADQNGFGMDAQWTDEFHHALRVTAGEPPAGYYSDFNGIEHLAKAYSDGYVYTGQYSNHRQKNFGSTIVNNPAKQFVVFSQNHDQVGNRMLGERSSTLYSFEMLKLLAGSVLVSPFLPMLFMGEEMGETNPFQYFISHEDPELVEMVRKGRKEEFKAFHADGEAPDPQAEETFNNSKIQWHLIEQQPNKTLFVYYKTLIELRKTLPALKNLSRKDIKVSYNSTGNTLILYRWYIDQAVACIMNFSDSLQTVSIDADVERWGKVFDSADPQWQGPASSLPIITKGASLAVQPQSIIIYTKANV